MTHLTINREEFVQRGEDYYDRFLRDELEPGHKGKFLALNIETGEYEMDADEMAAIDRARAFLKRRRNRHPLAYFVKSQRTAV